MGVCTMCNERESVPGMTICNECGVAKHGACTDCGTGFRCSPHHTFCAGCVNRHR